MDPITATLNVISSITGLVTALTQLETVNRAKESDPHREAREAVEIEAYKLVTVFLKALPRPEAVKEPK